MALGINFRSHFVKSALVLTSGTVMAQAVAYVFTPVITRLFSPDEIGELGVYTRIIAFVASLATARYELALPLPKTDSHAFQLYRLAIRISLVTSSFCFLGGLVYWVSDGFSNYSLLFGLAVVAGTFFMSFRAMGVNWAIRTKAFKRISFSKISSALSTNVLAVLGGLAHFGVSALILATAIGHVFGSLGFIRHYRKSKVTPGFERSKPKMQVLAKEHRDLPRINLPHVLLDTGRDIILAFLIIEFFDKTVFGSFDHSFRMLKLPLVLIGASIGQIFFKQCSDMYNARQPMYPLLKKTIGILFLLSLIPFGVIYFYGEPLFSFVFGDEWDLSGEISEVLAPWLMINFIASPLSFVPIVIGRQAVFFWLGLTGAAIQVIGFSVLPVFIKSGDMDILDVFRIVSFTMAIFLIFVVIFNMFLTRQSDIQRRIS